MGFGHRMYKSGDPRAPLMRGLAEALAAAKLPESDPQMVQIGAFVEEEMLRRKNMHPNVDFSAAIAYKQSAERTFHSRCCCAFPYVSVLHQPP